MSSKRIAGLRKGTLITAILVSVIIFIPIAMMLVSSIAGPKEISDSALLDEQIIRYKGNDYYFVNGVGDGIKSGKCIKRSVFETYYLNEGGSEYIIRSSLHERHIFKREDLLENRYKLLSRNSKNEITYENDNLMINGEQYRLIDTFDKMNGDRIFEPYLSVGSISFNSHQLDVNIFKDNYECNLVYIQDDKFIVNVFAKTAVDMDAYTAADISKLTSFYVNFNDRRNKKYDNPDVVDALKSLRSHENSICSGDIYDIRPQGEHMSFDLIFDDLPICFKCRINITLCDDGIYYNIEDGTDDCYYIYKVTDNLTENVFLEFYKEFQSENDI